MVGLGAYPHAAWNLYNLALASHPIFTKCMTSLTCFILSDTVAQLPSGKFDALRTARFAAFGFAVHAPTGHVWYNILDNYVYPSEPTSARAVVAKMALDQLFWTPIALVLFFACFTLLEGRSMAYLRSQLRAKFLPTLVKGFALWPAAHLVNFRYVPNGMRILYVNMVQLLWNVVLCRVATQELSPGPKRKLREEDAERRIDVEAQCSTQSIAMPTRR